MLTDIINKSSKYIKMATQVAIISTTILAGGCDSYKENPKPTLTKETEKNIIIKENPRTNKYAIMVHGFKGSTKSLSTIESVIKRQYNIHNFNYPSSEMDLSSHRINLETRIKSIVDLAQKQGIDPEIHLFAHSTGGRIVVDALHHLDPKYRKEVEKAILLAPCLGGSEISDFGQNIKSKLDNSIYPSAKFAKKIIVDKFGEKTFHQLSPSSPYMKYTLKNVTFHPETDYLILAGFLENNPFDKAYGELNDEVIRLSNQLPYLIRGFNDNPNNKAITLENVSHTRIAHHSKSLNLIKLYLNNQLNIRNINYVYNKLEKNNRIDTFIIGINRADQNNITEYEHFQKPSKTINNESLIKKSLESMFQEKVISVELNSEEKSIYLTTESVPRKIKMYIEHLEPYLILSSFESKIKQYKEKLK